MIFLILDWVLINVATHSDTVSDFGGKDFQREEWTGGRGRSVTIHFRMSVVGYIFSF